jgi:hypothetical protein
MHFGSDIIGEIDD